MTDLVLHRTFAGPFVVAGEDITDWTGCDFARVLADGRILLVQKRPYNSQLSVSTPAGWPHIKDDMW